MVDINWDFGLYLILLIECTLLLIFFPGIAQVVLDKWKIEVVLKVSMPQVLCHPLTPSRCPTEPAR